MLELVVLWPNAVLAPWWIKVVATGLWTNAPGAGFVPALAAGIVHQSSRDSHTAAPGERHQFPSPNGSDLTLRTRTRRLTGGRHEMFPHVFARRHPSRLSGNAASTVECRAVQCVSQLLHGRNAAVPHP
ncbi:hypothetical protein Kisp01_45380 [Kineosporia sp. NBRC 101677]|nr:hypothetical protein Kisp01_45380 [Kineosporia sp. NBRC 101677]